MRLTRVACLSTLGGAGLILASRALFGPLNSPIPIHSALNAEGWFALAALLLMAIGSVELRGRVDNPPQVGNLPYLSGLIVLIGLVFVRAANGYFLSDDFLIVRYANEYHLSL